MAASKKLTVWGWLGFMDFPDAETVRGKQQQVRFAGEGGTDE